MYARTIDRPLAIGRAGLLALVALGVAGAVLAGARPSFLRSDRDVFVALFVVGWVMCSAGVGPVARTVGWRHPAALGGVAMGLAALGLAGLVLSGAVGPSGERAACVVFAGLLLVKSLVAVVALAAAETEPAASGGRVS